MSCDHHSSKYIWHEFSDFSKGFSLFQVSWGLAPRATPGMLDGGGGHSPTLVRGALPEVTGVVEVGEGSCGGVPESVRLTMVCE